MEPFIQLNYAEQCPRQSLEIKETPFVDTTKVSELFWIDLLKAKCVEGLGEVCENLLNDEILTPDDFIDDQHVSAVISGILKNNSSCNNCLVPSKSGDCKELKTPVASKYVHKSFETPCLFSQDESVNVTPLTSPGHVTIKSQSRCDEDSQTGQGSSISDSQVLHTPASLSCYSSTYDWRKRTTKTPDALAEIMGRGKSSLSFLLAGSDDDEVAEWSESMATPPLKITRPAANIDETDDEAEDAVDKFEGDECNPTSKRIARVLFYGSTNNQSIQPLEVSLDDAVTSNQLLDIDFHGNAVKPEGKAEDTSIHDEFIPEDSCCSNSKCEGENLSKSFPLETLLASPSITSSGNTMAESGDKITTTSFDDISRSRCSEPAHKQSGIHFPFTDNFLSPSCRIPLKALAQSTPKPVVSSVFDAVQDGKKEGDTNLSGSASSFQGCEKTPSKALYDVSCLASEHTDVTFGSPSRSFELAMARETDKHSSKLERGSSISPVSPHLEGAFNDTGIVQPTEVSHQENGAKMKQDYVTLSTPGTLIKHGNEGTTKMASKQPRKPMAVSLMKKDLGTETSHNLDAENQTTEENPSTELSCVTLTRKKSFCKAPGLRRSVRTKRFLCPTANQRSNEDSTKRFKAEGSSIDESAVLKKDNLGSADTREDARCDDEKNVDDKVVCILSCGVGKGGLNFKKKGKLPTENGCDDNRAITETKEYEDDLIDMDSLSQFPVDCLLSPPYLKYSSVLSNAHSSSSVERLQCKMNVTYTVLKKETQTSLKEFESHRSCSRDDLDVEGDRNSIGKTENSLSREKELDVFAEPFSSPKLNTSPLPADLTKPNPLCMGENTDKILDKSVKAPVSFLKESEPRKELSALTFISRECEQSVVDLNNVFNRLEKSKGNTTDETRILDMHAIPGKSASSESGGNCASTADDVEKFCMDMSNSSTLKSAKNDVISSEIVGFHTASGKRVSVSLEALAKAKTALEQVDISLGLHKGPSGGRLQSSGEQVKLSERSVKQADEINVNSPDGTERRNSCSSVPDELDNFMIGRQRVPFTSSGNDLVSTLSGSLDKAYRELDSYESDTKLFETSSRPESYSGENLCQAKGQRIVQSSSYCSSQIGETAVLNVGDIESKRGAFVNDSLLEDLLNDCKMKRRDSLESILIKQSEKTLESLKEGKRGNNDSELNGSSSTSCNQEVLEQRENVTPALRRDAWSRNKSTFESDDVSFFPGNGNGTNTEEKVSGAEIPSPENTSNYRTTSRNAVLQTASEMLAKISQHTSQGASSNMKEINEELFDDEQSNSKRGYLGFCEMQSAYKEPNADSKKESPTIRDSRTSDGSVSTESPPKKTVNSFPGFLTAGGKKVALSEESLKAGRDIMRRLTEDEVIPCTLPCHLVNVETHPVSKRNCEADVSMQARDNLGEKRDCNATVHMIPLAESVDADKNSFNQNHLLGDKNKKQSLEFFGFQTASGKRVGLSKEALQKGAVIMDQIDRSLNQNEEQRALNNPRLSHFHCFQTAEGRSVKLSNESVKKGVIIMQQIDRSLGGGPEEIAAAGECGVASFHTEVRERLNKPQKFPGKGKAVVQVLDERQAEERKKNKVNPPLCPGFQTAAGRSVKISKESLQKGAAIMQQIDKSLDFIEEGRRFASGNSGLQNDNEQSVKRVRDSLCIVDAMKQEGEKVLKQIKANSSTNSDSASVFPGFRRANEQGAALSKESIAREATITQHIDKSLVENVESITSASCGATCIAGFRTASGQGVKLSKESLKAGEAIMREIDNCLHREIKGDDRSKSCNAASSSSFHTAGGQSLKLSEESLAKEVARMPEIDNFLIEDNNVSSSWDTSSFTGFQTASGQNVRLSKNSLEKGAQIMRHIDRSLELKADDVGSCSSPTFCGFQTACGKTVQISESALSKGKETMAVIDKEIRSMSLRSEYRDIVSKSTEQEKSALEESCNGRVLVEECKDEGTFKGFFTAGGSSVSVSEKALAKAKELLLETDIAVDGSIMQQGASLKERSIPLITIDPKKSRTADDDDDVSREVLESSKALLADESFLDVSEYLPDKHDQCAATITPLETSASRSLLLERQQRKNHEDVASVSKAFQSMHHSTPLRCSEEEFRSNHSWTRNGMKPYATTPSGILHDRRARSFHVQLRARQSSFEHINTLGSARSVANRSLKPLKASSPGFFKAKTNPLPRTSTPVNPNTSHRTIPSPRPPFVTPYRRQRACKDVSPLTRTSASTGFPVVESLEGELSAAITEPSPKKAKLSAPNSAFNASSTPGGGYKVSELTTPTNYKTKPQPGFLSQLRRRGQRIRLKEFVGNATPGGYKADELIELGVKQELLSVTPFNATSFRFKGDTYFSEAALCDKKGVRTEDGGIVHVGADGGVGLEEIQSAFLCTPGVDRELISDGWIANHYRWLVWKLAAMEVSFPRHFAGRCLTPDWLLCQMKYRYDREVDNSNRSALKKVMERDDAASRTMILCVSSVWLTDDASVPLDDSKKEGSDNDNLVNKKTEQMPCAVIELTDGWYSIRGLLDGPLTRLLRDKRLIVGQKLCIHGAELVGSDQAVSPLEAPSSLMLRLHANSTRRARWDAKLGFHRHMHAFPLPLASLYGDGGFTGCVDVIVLRQYPLQWMEKMPDGTNIFRNSRLEEREAKKFEEEHHRRREKLFIKIQEEFEKEIEQPERRRSARFRCRSFSSNDVKGLFDGKEIYEALTQASDPDALRECLDERQVRALEGYKQSLQEKKCAELQSKFERVWKEQTEKGQFHRNAIPLLKVRINDYSSQSQAKQSALLSIWRPSEEIMQLLCEGSRLRIYHLTTAGIRSRYGNLELQLSATRTTRYEALSSDPDGLRSSYLLRQVCSFDELRCRGSSPHSLEVDMVGLVVFCSPLSSTFSSSSSVQTVYLSDEKNNVVAVKFWGGLQAFAVDDLVKPRCFICCSNLTIRPDDRLHQCTSLAFNELSSLTMKPRELHLRNALHKLQQNIPDVDEFMAGIQETLTSLLRPHRSSPPADVQVNTVRMYGNVKDTAPPALNTITESTDKENCSNFKDGDDDLAGVTQSGMGNDNSGETQEQRAPSFENCAALSRTQGISSRALDRQVKRKLLDSIAEPPPLLPLHSPIPVSVRRDFKRPRSLRSSKLPLEH